MPADVVIRIEGSERRADQQLLLHVDELSITAGERVAIVGPNGAGKSSLLRLIGGMVRATCGRVQVLGREIGPEAVSPLSPVQRRALRAEIGQVMQGLHLVPRLSARENVLIGALARLRGADGWRSWARLYPAPLLAEADAALAALGMSERAHSRSDQLSGGERQKVSLARLMLQRPRLILADEPTAALDPAATQLATAALLRAARGGTLLTVLHDRELLPLLATRVLGVARGRIAWDLPVEAVDADALQSLYASDPAAIAAGPTRRLVPAALLTA
jgi:phosphonate transport system ATP-binding protein